jgi:calcineurin-like phosphoesterase family protein
VSDSGSSAVSRHRQRRRRRRLIRISISAVSALVIGALVVLAIVSPPSFLSSSSEETPSPPPATSAAPTTVAPTQTPSASPTSTGPVVRFAIAGDTGTRNESEARTAKRMVVDGEKDAFEALLLLGDIVYEVGDSALTRRSVSEPFAGVLKTAKLIPLLGNHDVQSGEQQDILRQLGRDSAWYVEQVGPVRVIVLDSNRVNDQQTAWLRDVLAEKQPSGTWTIAAMHHPAYSAGEHGSALNVRRRWSPLFEAANVPLVLAGHDHDYQRSRPQNDVTYVVSGAGAKLRKVGRKSFTAVSTSTRHYLDLRVFEDRLVGRAVAQDGRIFDKFTIRR